MNIRFLVLPFVLVALISVPAFAQGPPKTPATAQSGTAVSAGTASGASAGVDPGLPNEKNLLIGSAPSTGSTPAKPIKQLGVWSYIQMILVLALVIGGIYLLFYFLKRVSGTKFQENAVIGVLSTKVLQPNRSLHVVDVGGRLYLIGTSENSVSLVASIEEKEAIDEIRLRASQASPRTERKAFRDVFSGAFRKGGAGGFGFGGPLFDSMGFIKQQRERLKKM